VRTAAVGSTLLLLAAPAFAQCDAVWTRGPDLPAARRAMAAAYDSARGRVVLFGGVLSNGSISNATLEFDGAQWHTVSPGGTIPTARSGSAMAYDALRERIVLFGGQTVSGATGGTYEYDGQSWVQTSPTGSPSARSGAAMAFDPARGVVVLHAGLGSSGTVFSQTFDYNGAAWTLRTTSGPARHLHAMTYSDASQSMVLFGGFSGDGSYMPGAWKWSGEAWSLLSGTQPPARVAAGIAHVTPAGRTLLFGGRNAAGPISGLWELDPAGWTFRNSVGPAPRSEHALVYHAAAEKVVLIGGLGTAGMFNDTWLLSVGGGPTFTSPPASQSATPGQAVEFSAAANGSPTSWRWRRNGEPITDDQRISGAATPTLTITDVLETDAGAYDLLATNGCGTTASPAAVLTVGQACGTADFDGDGDTGTDADIETFFACLAGNCCPTCFALGADFNADGDTGTDADIESFFRVLAGGGC
jgi:hypothetical protein